MSQKADEFEYLKWFFINCDFGPAHEDVMFIMNNQFKKETGLDLPEGYEPE